MATEMTTNDAATATDMYGAVIRPGDSVQKLNRGGMISETECAPDTWGPVVTVESIRRQGYDGTILYTDRAPDPDFPCHKSGRATDFRKV